VYCASVIVLFGAELTHVCGERPRARGVELADATQHGNDKTGQIGANAGA
jgi:hypothetical protein